MAELDNWPREIYSTEQVRACDRKAIAELGIEGFELMQRAARAALQWLQAKWPGTRSVGIFCGAGNNAGDGYVLAALAAQRGLQVQVFAVGDPDQLRGDAASAVRLAQEASVPIVPFVAADASGEFDLVVDALLGTGLTREVEGKFAQAVGAINAYHCPILALDVPSGLESDTGAIKGVAVAASATITFVGLKSGLYLGQGPGCRGELAFADLDLPAAAYAGAAPVMRRIDPADRSKLLKPRAAMAHKGSHGRLLVVGGAPGMAGAARLAAEAGLRAGAGLVYAAVAPDSIGQVAAGRPEIMCRAVTAAEQLGDLAQTVDVVVVGPGLGGESWGRDLAAAILQIDRPLVVDADALNYLARHRQQRSQWVITPHPAEAGRLLGRSAAEVQADRLGAVTALAGEFAAIAVLKGACSLVAQLTDNKDFNVSVCDHGNPGLATGGTGDVLAGLIGGLIAQYGLSQHVVEIAVLIHALAGDHAAAAGQRGMIASDLFPYIRLLVNPD